jgi:hypothetical protein
MRILLVGALSWNPERIRSLHERGHRLWGLWSRSMAWDQGPYPVLDSFVEEIELKDAPRVIREHQIDCVYSLFQEYYGDLLAPKNRAIKQDISSLLRALLFERQRGAFDAPIVRHWGFDIHQFDIEVARGLDANIFCNRQKFIYFTEPKSGGGCGFDIFRACEVTEFMDSDRPKLEFMNDNFASPLSDSNGEIHTVCIGRPFGIDYLAAARNGIHVHIYGNNYDRVGIDETAKVSPRVHIHSSMQTVGANWTDVQRTKARWVPEFSQYDAGWSYIGDPIPWTTLENRAAIPNRLSTYVLAGIPIITDCRPGFYRYNEPHRLGVAIDFDGDYGTLRERLEAERKSRAGAASARHNRNGYSFDATINPLIGVLEHARTLYFARPHAVRSRFVTSGRPQIVFPGWHRPPRAIDRMRKWLLRGSKRVWETLS